MSYKIDTKYRSKAIELMDDFSIDEKLLRPTLDEIAKINRFLGGNTCTLDGVKELLKHQSKTSNITIVDIGCGNGDMLRAIANYGRQEGYTFTLIGVDANLYTVNYANELSEDYSEITVLHQDIFSEEFKSLRYDMVLSTLFMHHFTDNQIIALNELLIKNTKLGVVINDLHRHKMAYYLFKLVCLVIKSPMAKKDGAISILRGFKRKELEAFVKQLKVPSTIKWKWAFRYQIIIKKNL